MNSDTSGKPLSENEIVPEEFEDEALYDDDGLAPPDEDQDEAGSSDIEDRENQAGSEAVDPEKFTRP